MTLPDEVEFDTYNLYEDWKESSRMYDECYVVYARNQEHAIKIARDMEAEYQAQQKGLL